MKILAFSDWEKQSIELINTILNKEKPDAILYGGDHLSRLIEIKNLIYIITPNNFLKLNLSDPEDFLKNNKVKDSIHLRHFIREIKEFVRKKPIFNSLKLPFYYIFGNHEYVIKKEENYYLELHPSTYTENKKYGIYENENNVIECFLKDDLRAKERAILSSNPEYNRIKKVDPINPTSSNIQWNKLREIEKKLLPQYQEVFFFIDIKPPIVGKFTIGKISIYGSWCNSLDCKIINAPEEHADIYLSHLPPFGVLDLSSTTTDHIGSKELLVSIKSHRPKFVICGHTHKCGGVLENVDNTIILNISSDTHQCNYAILNTADWFYQIKSEYDIDYGMSSMIEMFGSTIKEKLKKVGRIYLSRERYIEFEIKTEDIDTIFSSFDLSNGLFYCDLNNFIDPIKKEYFVEKDPTRQKIAEDFLSKELYIDIEKSYKDIQEAKLILKEYYKEKTILELIEILNRVEKIGIDTSRVRAKIKSKQTNEHENLRSITINPNEHYFVDVETGAINSRTIRSSPKEILDLETVWGSKPGKLWLIGIGNEKEIKQFIYPEQEKQFVEYLKNNNIKILVSWTTYDRKVLQPILESYNIEIKFYDACQRTRNSLIWYTYKLHQLHDILFPKKELPQDIISGAMAGLYADHLLFKKKACSYCLDKKEKILDQIKERNKQDIILMIDICKILYKPQIYKCPDCKFKTKHKKSLDQHIKNKICKKPKIQIIESHQTSYNKDILENLAHFNEYGVFICDCKKSYLSHYKTRILNHINSCPQFNYKLKQVPKPENNNNTLNDTLNNKEQERNDLYQSSFNEKDLESLAHFNNYGVFVCNCGKKYLPNSQRYILEHINQCVKFIFKTKIL